MFRFLWTFLLVIGLSALAAAGALLWLSTDPEYTIKEWLNRGRFNRYDDLIVAAAQKQGVDPMLIKAIVWRESAFRPEKVGTSGERGLMQVGEAAARDWAKAAKIETFAPTDLFDPKTNLDAGVWYFRKALEHWKAKPDPVPFALAEYNAGRGRVERWVAKTKLAEQADAQDLMSVMDFPTTRKYVTDITERYRFYRERKRL